MHRVFCAFFSGFGTAKNYWNRLRFDRVAVKCTLLRFMNHGKNVGFNFSRYGAHCTHKSGDVVNFTTVACRISSRLKCYKNYKNRLRSAKVIVKNKLPHFLWFTLYYCYCCCYTHLTAFFPAQPASTRRVNHSGFYWSKRWWGGSGISWTIYKSFAPRSRQITMPLVPHRSVFTGNCNRL